MFFSKPEYLLSLSQASLDSFSSWIFSPSTATRGNHAWRLFSHYNLQPLYSDQQFSTAILLCRVHLSRALSSPPQLVASVSGHQTISVVLLCRRCHSRIQASSCSSSPSLSRHIRDQATMVDFQLFSDLVLHFLISFDWVRNFYFAEMPS